MASSARIGALRIDLGMNTAAFEKGATLAERRMNKLAGNMKKLSAKFMSIGKTLSLGVTAPLAAFGVTAFNAASDAAELESMFEVTFGNMSKAVRAWAVETGDAMGRSTQEMMGMAASFQDILKKQMDPAAAAELSKNLTVLTQDLASFKNLSNDVAQQKIFSGLIGEAEPLRAVGVLLSAATTEAKALEMGLAGANGEISEGAKVQARAALIMEQLADAQGDVIRTSGSTANQLKAAQAAFEELQVVIGTKLLPVITPLITKLAEALNWFTRLPDGVQTTIMVVAGLSAALGPLLMGLGALIPLLVKLAPLLLHLPKLLTAVGVAFRFMLGPIGLAITAIGAVYMAWKNWDKIEPILRRLVTAAKTWIMDKLAGVLAWILNPIAKVKGAFADLYDAVVGNSYIPDMVDGIADHMARLDKAMVDPATKAAQKTADVMREMAGEVRGILDRLFPEAAAVRSFRDDLSIIENDKNLTADQKSAARGALLRELEAATARQGRDVNLPDVGPIGDIDGALKAFDRFADKLTDKAGETKVRVVKTFKDMAEETMRTFQDLANAIKGGGFLDILGGIINMGLQLGSIGLFGKKIAGNINSSFGGARAAGGPVSFGKSYLVGENGPEMFTPGQSGNIIPNHAMGGGATYIIKGNLLTPEFWAQIQAGDIAAANAGGDLGVARVRHRQSRRVA